MRIKPCPLCAVCGAEVTSHHGGARARRRGYGYCSMRCAGVAKLTAGKDSEKDTTQARLNRYLKDMPTGCREFTGQRDPRGYGRITAWGRRGQLAHRVAWEIANGPIPNGLFVCHACDNPPCCRIGHLWLGTNSDNARDMVQKGRNSVAPRIIGEQVNTCKLTPSLVRELRSSPMTAKELAEKYSISRVQVRNILSRRHWKHVE